MFQRRVLDLVEQVSKAFGFQFWYWCPAGKCQGIQPSGNPIEKGAWLTLPVFNASFLFLPPDTNDGEQRKGQWLLDIHVVPDTGFSKRGKMEPDPANFPDPNKCQSMLGLYAFIVTKHVKKNWVFGIWGKYEWPEQDGVADTDEEGGIRVLGLRTGLAHLGDRDAVLTLANRFRDMVRKEGGVV